MKMLADDIEVKVIYDTGDGIEANLRDWLNKYPNTVILDIKFGHGGTHGGSTSKALIIYVDDGKFRL